MRVCGVVMCGVLALAWVRPALALDQGLYVGLETRVQRAEMSVEKGQIDFGAGLENVKPFVDEAQGRNSINAVRVGYLAEVSSDLFVDASLALGTVDPASAVKFSPPGQTFIETGGFLDSTLYLDIAVGVRGSTGDISYTGGFRYERSSIEEDTETWPGGVYTVEFEQSCLALEGTIGTTGDVRAYVGAGFHIYKGELTETDTGVKVADFEFEYDLPFVVFVGVESSTERVSMFARMSLLGEKFLSTWAGAAVKF